MTPLAELDRHRYLSLATYRRSGVEVATPVWFAPADGRLYVFTAGNAGKVKRLRHTPRVRVAPATARGRVLGPWTEGAARVVIDPRIVERAHAAMRARYGWQMRLADALARLTGRLRRRAWIEIEVPEAPEGRAQRPG